MRSKEMQVAFSLLLSVVIVIQQTIAAPVNNEHFSTKKIERIYAMAEKMQTTPPTLPNPKDILPLINENILPTLQLHCGETIYSQLDYGKSIVDKLLRILPNLNERGIPNIISNYPSMKDKDGTEVAMALLKCLHEERNIALVEIFLTFRESFFRPGTVHNFPAFLKQIHVFATQMRKFQMLHHLYKARITPDEMILLKYQTLQIEDVPFDSLCQFIADSGIYTEFSKDFNQPQRSDKHVSHKRVPTKSPTTSSVFLGKEPSSKRRKIEGNDASSSAHYECTSKNVQNGRIFSSDGDVSVILSQISVINQKREFWQEKMYEKETIVSKEFKYWLKNEVIPYMRNVGNLLNLLYYKDENHEHYHSALVAVDQILYLLKDAVLSNEDRRTWHKKLPGPYYAMLPKKFFCSLGFFEFGVEFHTILVKKNYLELQITPGDLNEKLKMFIENSKESVKLIKKFQSPMNLEFTRASVVPVRHTFGRIKSKNYELIENELEKFTKMTEITPEDIEQFVMHDENPLNVLLIQNSSDKLIPAADLLGVSLNDVYLSSHPLVRGLEPRTPCWDKFSLSWPRLKHSPEHIDLDQCLHLPKEKMEQIHKQINKMQKLPRQLPNAQEFVPFVNMVLLTMEINCGKRKCPQLAYGMRIAREIWAIFPHHYNSEVKDIISNHPSMKDNDDREIVMALLKCHIQEQNLKMINELLEYENIPYFPIVLGKERDFMQKIHQFSTCKKQSQMLYHLYDKQTTPKEMIHQSYQELNKDGLTFDSLCQFIADGGIYNEFAEHLSQSHKGQNIVSHERVISDLPDTSSVASEKVLSSKLQKIAINDDSNESSPKRRNIAVNDASSSAGHESKSTNELNCEFFSKDGDVLKIISESFGINLQREKWQQHIYNNKPIEIYTFGSWLTDQVIPYMKNVGSHLNLLYHNDENHKHYNSALITIDKILFLLKDASLQHQKRGFFGYRSTVPAEFFHAVLFNFFFESLVFFEFGVEFHIFVVKRNYLQLRNKSGDLDENLNTLICRSKNSVELIKKYQSPMNLQAMKSPEVPRWEYVRSICYGDINLYIDQKFEKLAQKDEISSDDIEEFVMPDENSFNAISIGPIDEIAVDLLGVQKNDIYYSSHPVFSKLDSGTTSWDKISLFRPRSTELPDHIHLEDFYL